MDPHPRAIAYNSRESYDDGIGRAHGLPAMGNDRGGKLNGRIQYTDRAFQATDIQGIDAYRTAHHHVIAVLARGETRMPSLQPQHQPHSVWTGAGRCIHEASVSNPAGSTSPAGALISPTQLGQSYGRLRRQEADPHPNDGNSTYGDA